MALVSQANSFETPRIPPYEGDLDLYAIDFEFNDQDVLFDLPQAPLELPPHYRSSVEGHWKQVNGDGRFFNGKVLTATSIQSAAVPPRVSLTITDYAHYLYAASDPNRQIDCHAVYCAAVIVTSDRYLLLGQMGSQTSAPGRIQCPGGNIEMGADQTVNARACCQREIAEEVGGTVWSDQLWFRPMCIKTGGRNGTIGLFYMLMLRSDAKWVLSMFDKHQAELTAAGEEPELKRLHSVKLDPAVIEKFCDDQKDDLVDYLRPLFLDRSAQISAAAPSVTKF